MSSDFKVRVVSPWPKQLTLSDGTIVSSAIELKDADALICFWQPSEELFEFPGPKLWYNCEPMWSFGHIDGGKFGRLAAQLPENILVNHRTENPNFRVPHITHWGKIVVEDVELNRIRKGIAIVTNNGGGASWIHQDLKLRNQFATDSKIDLYGKPEFWNSYRRNIWGSYKPPKNYRGEIPQDEGTWHGSQKRNLQSKYKAAVCLENACEKNYFTEKFVEAVRAGCIPIYHADEIVANTFLKGAAWVDPSDHGFKPGKTIREALDSNREEFSQKNRQWLASNMHLKLTQGEQVFEQLVTVLRSG